MTVSTTQIDRRQTQAQRGQRLKVGLIGLAAVLLLIGLASAVFNSVNRERPIAAIGAARPATVAEMTNATAPAVPANEPLAELGAAQPSAQSPANQTAPAPR